MTDFRRMIILGILFILGMMLWNSWTLEYADKIQAAKTQAISQATTEPSSEAGTGPTPSQSPAIQTANIPDRYITIKNDVIEAVIDRVGGNVVNVKLLKYPVSLKQPQDPVALLSNSDSTYYVANSGIIANNFPPADSLIFNAAQNGEDITLTSPEKNGLKIVKTYHFPKDDYLISLKQTVYNQSGQTVDIRMFNALTRKPPVESGAGPFNFNTYTGAVFSTPEKRYEKLPFKKMAEENLDQSAQDGWIAMTQHYFLSAWIPTPSKNYHFYTQNDSNDDKYTIGMQSAPIQVAPHADASTTQQLYVGPSIGEKLSKIAPGLNLTVDYGVLWFIADIIFLLMKKIHAVIGNWGWSIVLVTLIIKLLFYKLNSISFRSMAKMRELQPKLEQIRERCGDDRQKLAQATMELYRKEKANPMSGCLPLIVQIPVFLSLYWVIIESVELRQAPFILWIHDLSIKDPYYVLPLIMGLTIFIQQWLSPKPPDPVQRKVMLMMPIVFTALFLSFPAGLVLYWVANNTLSILQQWYIMNHVVPKAEKK